MKIFFTFLSFFLLISSLEAYSKKIVIEAFKNDNNAKNLLKQLPTTIPEYEKLQNLLQEDDAIIHVRKVGNYYLLVGEIFSNKTIAEKSLKIIKKKYKHAYINDAPSEEQLIKKAKVIAKLEQELKTLKAPKAIKKVDIIKEKSALEFVNLTFLISFIILMSLVYAFVNYKEKYDEY